MADNMSESKPTLKTIAQLTGLAIPTVSRALHDAPDIKGSTKELVQRTAREIGYVPNRAGVRLRTGKTNVISLVLSTENDMMNHTARLMSSIASGLRDTPYHMIVTPYFPDEILIKPVRYIVETGSADGIILNQTLPRDPRVEYLLDKGFPFATHGRTEWSDQHAYFDYDNEAFGRLAVASLADRGRQNILMVAPPAQHSYSDHMRTGAEKEARKRGVNFRVVRRVTSHSAGEDIRESIVDVLKENIAFDGLVCGSTTAAMASASALESQGSVVGEDADIFMKEALPFLKYFRNDIIAIHESVERAGYFLADAVRQAIIDPTLPPMQGMDIPTADDITK